MQTIAWLVTEQLWHKGRIQTIGRSHGLNNTAEGNQIIC